MTSKLPTYFEKFLNEKFEEISKQITILKEHVNDEILDLKKIAETNQKNIQKLWVVVLVLIIYHIIVEEGASLLTLIKTLV